MSRSPDADRRPGTRSDVELACEQLEAIDRWHASRRALQQAAERTSASREARMDLARRLDVVRAQHRAIVARTHAHLDRTVELLRTGTERRAVVVHRNAWFTDRLCSDLAARSVVVVARLTNGAEAVGAVVAEQPDLVLVEDTLPMLCGEEIVREVRRFSPRTRIGAQVAYDDGVARMLEAGADSAFTRRVPPVDVASGLADLLGVR